MGSAVSAPYTGYYFVSAWLKTTNTGGTNQWYVRLDVAGVGTVANGASDWLEGNGRHWRVVDWLGVLSAGQQIYAVSVLQGGTFGSINITGNLYVNFMPTDGYPG